mmetsp:Transcript_49861/g.156049  ORF Transcript_49861/g.156049 Transcript_49861/m.156049 type:complete len:205 (-) Transcript_49861:50-664(-)
MASFFLLLFPDPRVDVAPHPSSFLRIFPATSSLSSSLDSDSLPRPAISSKCSPPSSSSLLAFLSKAASEGCSSLYSLLSLSIWNSGFSNSALNLSSSSSLFCDASFFLSVDRTFFAAASSFPSSSLLDMIFSANSRFTLGSGSLRAILSCILFSTLSLIFFFLYSSYSNGFITALLLAYNCASRKKPCMYAFTMFVPTSPPSPS